MPKNNWYVITGGPSTGKTTLLLELEKLGHKVIPEAARTVIDNALAKGIPVEELRADEKRFQEDVTRLKEQVEASLDPNELAFFDRGMHDTLAYLRSYGFAVEKFISKLMKSSKYQKVFLLEALPSYEEDYARTEGQDFINSIHLLLHDAYAEFDMKPVLVPAMSVEERVKFILSNVKMEQPA